MNLGGTFIAIICTIKIADMLLLLVIIAVFDFFIIHTFSIWHINPSHFISGERGG